MLGWDKKLYEASKELNTYNHLSIAEIGEISYSTSLDKNRIILIDKSKTGKVRK